jgi:hypothetical protein
MAEAGFWVAWGLPTQLNEARGYLESFAQDRQIERFDIAILKPQTTELGGFILIQGAQEQIDSLRRDDDFQVWVNRMQLVAGRTGIVDAWVDEGLAEATDLYEQALRKAGALRRPVQQHRDPHFGHPARHMVDGENHSDAAKRRHLRANDASVIAVDDGNRHTTCTGTCRCVRIQRDADAHGPLEGVGLCAGPR